MSNTEKQLSIDTEIDSVTFRKTMGLFATGITVVAIELEDEIHGMTANAFSSVSLDPPLVLVCVQKKARLAHYLQEKDRFSINILHERQEALSNYFANIWSAPEPPPFQFVPWVGGPRLAGSIGAIACTVHEILEGGDHWIVVGRVIDLYLDEDPAPPLLYFQGQYRQLA